MPKITKEVIKAFNADSLFYKTAYTNFTLVEDRCARDKIVITFDKNMTDQQCMDYLRELRSKMIKRFCPDEDYADMIFDVQSFPINLAKGKLQLRRKGGKKYVVPIDEGVICNLKCYLMSSFARRTEEKLGEIFGVGYMDGTSVAVEFDHKRFLHSTDFGSREVREKFIELFKEDISFHDNVPRDIFEIEDNEVSIKDIFKENPQLIQSITKRYLRAIGNAAQDLGNDSEYLQGIRNNIRNFISTKSGIQISNVSPVNSLTCERDHRLIPTIEDDDGKTRSLTEKEAKQINNKIFAHPVLCNVDKDVAEEHLRELLGENYQKGVYGMDLGDKAVAYVVLNKVIENSLINRERKLSIDSSVERSLSRSSTPPKTPRQQDSGAGPSSSFTEMQVRQPRQGSEKPRQGSEKPRQGSALYHNVSSEELVKKLLYMFNFNNFMSDGPHTNFTLSNGKIVALLNIKPDDRPGYLHNVLRHIIKNHCGTREKAEKIYDFNHFPFNFFCDFTDQGIIHDLNDADVFNLKIHLIQGLRTKVEKKVVEQLKKMRITRERIKEFVHLEKTDHAGYLCRISFSDQGFKRKEQSFMMIKETYAKQFKSSLSKYGKEDLIRYDGDSLYIQDAIDINLVKGIEEKLRREEEKVLLEGEGEGGRELRFRFSSQGPFLGSFPSEEVIGEVSIAFDDKRNEYLFDRAYDDCEVYPTPREKSSAAKMPTDEATSSGYSSMDAQQQGSSSWVWNVKDKQKASNKRGREERESNDSSSSQGSTISAMEEVRITSQASPPKKARYS